MVEIQTHILLIIRVREVIHPTGRIGIDIHNITIQEIPFAGQRTGNGTVHNPPFIINVCRILCYHNHFFRVYLYIGVLDTFGRIQAIVALGCLSIIINLIIIIHLTGIQHQRTVDRMTFIYALNSHLLIFCRPPPRNRLRPIQIRFDRISFPIFFYLI